MKKILFILATLALSTNLFSQIKLVKGSSTFLTENKTALVVFDYSNSQWENDEPLLENFDWGGKGSVPEKIELACNSFLRYFNENSRGLKIESCKAVDKDRVLYSKSIDDPVDYIITVRIINVERSGTKGWGRFLLRIDSSIEVTKVDSNEIIASFKVAKLKGTPDHTPKERIEQCFQVFAEKFSHFK